METILAIVCGVVIGGWYLVSRQPNEFRVARSRVINAPAAAIFPYVSDTHKFNEWSPFYRMDPQAELRYEGPREGLGAKFHWAGKKSGAGSMECIESRANEYTKQRLDFLKPFKGTNTAEFTLVPEAGGGTHVTWNFYGPNNFMSKVMGLFMNCSKMMEKTFDDGLQNLDEVVTGKAPAKVA